MKFIKTNIKDHKEKSYVDIDKAYKFGIVVAKNKKYRVRAYFLTGQTANKDKLTYPVFSELREFEREKLALLWIRKLLGHYLEEENE